MSTMCNFKSADDIISSIINASPVGMILVNRDGEIVFTNAKVENIFGFTNRELLGNSVEILVPEGFRKHHGNLMADYFEYPKPRPMGSGRNVVGLRKDGREIPVEIGLSPIFFDEKSYVLVSIVDISDRERANQLEESNKKLKLAANHDALTGMPNRRLFLELSENLLYLALRNNSLITVMFVDLDGFKAINDKYGHDVGDLLLCEVAAALRSVVRKSDVIGRIGGDEFLLCFNGLHNKAEVESISDNLLKAISVIRTVNANKINISASIGAVSSAVSDDLLLDDLVKIADKLMYEAKKAGKGKAVVEGCLRGCPKIG